MRTCNDCDARLVDTDFGTLCAACVEQRNSVTYRVGDVIVAYGDEQGVVIGQRSHRYAGIRYAVRIGDRVLYLPATSLTKFGAK